jgi:hypothetical protein
MIVTQMRKLATQAAAKHFSDIPGPKYYPLLGPLNDVMTLGKNEK